MKLVPVIFLLCLGSLIGCSTQPDQSTASSDTNSRDRETAEQPTTETDTADSAATVSTETEEEAEPTPIETEQQNGPPPTIGFAPGSDQAITSSATTNPEPETTGGLSIVKKVKELVPVSWFEQLRFWDMANRIIAKRNEEPADFDDAELREFATALKKVHAFHDHMYELQETLQDRADFANSEYFTEQTLASLRGETSLPAGTRDRGKKLSSLELYQVENDWAERIEKTLIQDQVSKGDLLRLSLRLREELMQFIALRESEIVLDEFLLSFPWKAASEYQLRNIQGWYPNVMKTTARELWTKTQPKWFKEDFPKLSKVNVSKEDPYEYVNPIEGSREPHVKTLPDVMANANFQELVALADLFEEMSGGGDRLLIFPEIGNLPLRDRVVEASKQNLAAIKEADAAALLAFRTGLYDQLSEEDLERLMKVKNADPNRLSFGVDHYLLNLDFDTSDYAVVAIIDDAIEKKQGLALFYERKMPKRDYFYKLVQTKRREVFDTGAKWYFAQSE